MKARMEAQVSKKVRKLILRTFKIVDGEIWVVKVYNVSGMDNDTNLMQFIVVQKESGQMFKREISRSTYKFTSTLGKNLEQFLVDHIEIIDGSIDFNFSIFGTGKTYPLSSQKKST